MTPRKTARRRTRYPSHRPVPDQRSRRTHRSKGATAAGPGHPDPYLPALSVRDADWLRSEMLRAVGRRFPGTRLVSPTSLRTPQGATLGLHRLATTLAATERRLWGEAVEHHVATLMSTTGAGGLPRQLEDYEDEELLAALRLRLVPTQRGMACETDEPELVPGIRLTHVLDLGGLLMTVPSSELFERLGEEAAEPAALSNCRQVIDRVHHSEPGHEGLHLIESESMLTAALALTLTDVCTRFHIPRPPLGHLVAVPEQECLLVMPVVGPSAPEAFTRLLDGAVHFYEQAEHPLSPLCFHVSADGVWAPVSQLHGSLLALADDIPAALSEALGLPGALGPDGDDAPGPTSPPSRGPVQRGAGRVDGVARSSPSAPVEDPGQGIPAEYAEAGRAILYGRLADLVETHGEDVTEEMLDAVIDRPIDLMVRQGPRSGIHERGRSAALDPSGADDALERLAALGEPGVQAILHLVRRQAEARGIDLDTLPGQ